MYNTRRFSRSEEYASSPRNFKKLVQFSAFWCIFWSDCVFKNSLKIDIFLYKKQLLYKYTLAMMGYLNNSRWNFWKHATIEAFQHNILKEFWIENGYFHVEIMISATAMLWGSGIAWSIISIRLSIKKYHCLLYKISIIATHLTPLVLCRRYPRNFKKHALVDAFLSYLA